MLRESRAGDLAHVEGRILEVDGADLERREVVHVGEDGLQRLGGLAHGVDKSRLFVVEPGLGQQFRHSDDPRQRRAHLLRDRREIIGLRRRLGHGSGPRRFGHAARIIRPVEFGLETREPFPRAVALGPQRRRGTVAVAQRRTGKTEICGDPRENRHQPGDEQGGIGADRGQHRERVAEDTEQGHEAEGEHMAHLAIFPAAGPGPRFLHDHAPRSDNRGNP